MSKLGHDTASGAGRAESGRVSMTGSTRALSTRQEVVRADTMASTVITAEIPAVPVHRAYGVLLPDGTVWYPGSKRRLPAPWPLRLLVWVLALITVLMLAGLAVVEWHSSWLTPLRHTVGQAPTVVVPPVQGTGTTTPGGGGTNNNPGSSHEISCSTAGTSDTCTVPATSYVIDFTTTNRCNVIIKQLPSGNTLYYDTQAAGETKSVPVTGSSSVEVYAGGSSIAIVVGSKTVGTIPSVKYAWLYTFEPASSSSG